ncbi:MAG: flagellar motor switch protein FliG, partial [Selenomonadaceae bacterium]|nr:flagellar motor switch protein FliG [Selenomonadaceae bacterium]
MYSDPKPMTSREKAAILFIALGGDYAAKIFEHMDDDEIETITLEIANNKQVSAEKK